MVHLHVTVCGKYPFFSLVSKLTCKHFQHSVLMWPTLNVRYAHIVFEDFMEVNVETVIFWVLHCLQPRVDP